MVFFKAFRNRVDCRLNGVLILSLCQNSKYLQRIASSQVFGCSGRQEDCVIKIWPLAESAVAAARFQQTDHGESFPPNIESLTERVNSRPVKCVAGNRADYDII